MTPPIFDETLLDLRAYHERGGVKRVADTNVVWKPATTVHISNSTMYIPDGGDVFVEQDMARYWLWWDTWVGPFTTEDAACAALMLLL